MSETPDPAPSIEAEPAPAAAEVPRVIYRHRLATRIWHWINAVTIFALIGSGLTISNAHKRLYWGDYGANFDHAWLEVPRWPAYVTIPSYYSLAAGRMWHLAFALVLAFGLLAYLITSLINRHIQRDLRVHKAEFAPKHLLDDIKAHLALRFHDPDNPGAYNIFQKLSYVGVLFGLLPLVIFTGLALSPGMDAAWPWLLDVFGGRQSARSIHFICMTLITLFIVVHLTLVILAGTINEVRSMITGKWKVPEE